MADIILHLDKGNTITLTNETNHEELLERYENTLITKVEITLDDVNETIYETYSLDENTLDVFDNLLYYDTNNLNCFDYYPFDEDFFKLFYKNKPYEAARDTHFGKVYWEDKYVTFDGYHWLKTANKIPYEDEAQEILSYWITEELERR